MLAHLPPTRLPQRKLIDAALLTHEEKSYLDLYHARVHDTIAPHLQSPDDATALAWLKHNTAPFL